MKKLITLFVILLISENIFSQSDVIYNQEFIISNLRIEYPKTTIEKSGITISFDLKMNAFDDYYSNPFYLFPNLKYNGEVVYNSASNKMVVYAKPDYKDTTNTNLLGQTFFIPYDEINLDNGNYTLDLELNAYNEFKDYKVIFSKKINIFIPKLYNYQEQEFKITNFKITDNIKMYDLRGINIEFDCSYKFLSSQIIGVSQQNDLKDYYFFIELENEKSGEKYNFFDNTLNSEKDEVVKLKNTISFFIPYHDLNIPKGKHQIKASLKVANKDKNIIFETIAETNFTISQPQIYFARLELKELVASYYKYDTPNIFGKIFSKKGSNRGYGYPDIFWIVELGNLQKFYSEKSENSFYAIPDITYFTVSDLDPISLSAYDFDMVGKNDFICKIGVKNNLGENFVEIRELKNDKLETINLTFHKILPVKFYNKIISVTPSKIDNISGVEVNFNYEVSSVFENDVFTIQPVIKQNEDIYELSFFTNMQDNNFKISSKNLKNNINIFIPYFNLQANSKIGFRANCQTSYQQLENVFYNEKILIPQKVDDIKIELDNITEKKIGDYYGFILKFNYKIPDLYLEKLPLNNLEAKLDIINTNSSDSLNFKAQLIDDEFNSLSKFFLDNTNSKNIFIPFYIVGKNNMDYDLKIFSEIKLINNEISLGNEAFDIKLPVSNIHESEIKKISLKFKEKGFYDKVFINIEHGKNTVFQSDIQSYNKKMDWELDNQKFLFHKKDNIYISLLGMDKYGISSVIYRWEIEGNQIVNKKKLSLKGKNEIRKIKIEF